MHSVLISSSLRVPLPGTLGRLPRASRATVVVRAGKEAKVVKGVPTTQAPTPSDASTSPGESTLYLAPVVA
jgi:hypothetical protein